MKDLDFTIAGDTPLATIALHSDAFASVLDRHQLDFCCGGARTLSQACAADGLDAGAVLAELAAEAGPPLPTTDWRERPIPDVIDFIVGTHHAYTRTAIARIAPLLAKVVARHGEHQAELGAVATAFHQLADDLGPHMLREERVLFPYLRALATQQEPPPVPFGSVRNPVRMMMLEHDRAARLLADLFDATGAFVAPPDGCASYTALYAALAELRLDLLRHVSLENNVLFPRGLALEESRQGDRSHAADHDRTQSLSSLRPNGRTMRP